MRFIDNWFPLIVMVREGTLEQSEQDQMCSGFERYFARGERYAVLSVALRDARPPDALARRRLATWLNQPRVRGFGKELCAGSATVTAGAWERHAMTALSWIWSPVAPHRAVPTVAEGLGYCLDRLVAEKLTLPSAREQLEGDVQRGLALLPLAGGKEAPQRSGSRARQVVRSPHPLASLSDSGGQIVIGWVAEDVLWASFRGQLSVPLADAYVERLGQLLAGASDVRYFIDSRSLDSVELPGRGAALRALISHQAQLRFVLILSWAGGVSVTARALLDSLGNTPQVTRDAAEFEARLVAAAPRAREVIEGQGAVQTARRL